MAYVMVNKNTVEQADGCRKEMMRAAIDLCAGRITLPEFNSTSLDFAWASELCYSQPTAGITPWLLEQLNDFYPVEVEKADDGYVVTYRHKSLAKQHEAAIPSGLYDGRHPVRVEVETIGGEFDVVTMDYVGHVDRHFKVEFQEKWMR